MTENTSIESILPRGAENAIPSKELMELAGCHSVRKLQMRIAAERENGAVILSRSTGGYFLPDEGTKGQQEAAAFVGTLEARAKSTFHALTTARQMLRNIPGQEEIQL